MTKTAWRKTFDRDQDFIVRRKFTLDGKVLVPGSPFPKERVPTRRLRQMYDQRTITFASDPTPGAQVSPERSRKIKRKPEAESAPVVEPIPEPKPPAQPIDERAAVAIPSGWETMPWPLRLQLAAQVSDTKVHNAAEAEVAITAELARRDLLAA